MVKNIHLTAIAIFTAFVFICGSCNKNAAQNELFEIEYTYDFELQGGLLTVETHVFEFLNKSTQVEELLDENSLDNVKSVKLKSAELLNYENDGGLEIIRRLESFIYPHNADDEYYDVAYTVELPRKKRDFIQLFSSGDEFKGLYEHNKMDVTLEIQLWQVPQRSRNLRYRFTIGFYN